MAQLTQRDVMVLFTMSLAIVVMSFIFPAFGIGGEEVQENEIPELNVSEGRFDMAGESPEFPNSPTKGSLWFNTTQPADFSENSIWLTGDTSSGVQLTLIENASSGDAEVILTRWNGSVAEQDRVIIDENNTRGTISVQGYRLAIEEGPDNNPPTYLDIDWKVAEGGESDGWFGSVFGAARDVAEVLAWFVLIFIWASTSVIMFFLNAVDVIFQASSYLISLLTWLATTYGGIVAASPSWTKVFVALPGIILSATLGKILIIFIGLLPTT